MNGRITDLNFYYSYEDFLNECEAFAELTKNIEDFKWNVCEVINNSLLILNMVHY